MRPLRDIVESYNAADPLDHAYTIPASWYADPRIAELERECVFGGTWQVVARSDQLRRPGTYITTELAGEPHPSGARQRAGCCARFITFAAITPPRS